MQLKKANDQAIINAALMKVHLEVIKQEDSSASDCWEARNTRGFKVTILNEAYICRHTCTITKKSSYYVWHNAGKTSKSKLMQARINRMWYLRKDWNSWANRSQLEGIGWIKQLQKPDKTNIKKKKQKLQRRKKNMTI